MNMLSESDIHQFNLNTLSLDKELESLRIDLLLMPGEIQKRAVVAAQWHTAMDRQVCPLCNSLQGEIIPVDSPEWGRIFPPVHLGCFLSNRTPIYTLDGWKKIDTIKVGDYVLTHKGRFRRVTRLFRSRSYRGKVIMVTMNGSSRKFVVTPEHPFLTETGWKKAIDLKISDKIMIMASRCRRCKELTPYYLKYCSRSCNSKDITDRQWSDPKHRKLMSFKISQQMKRQYKLGIRDPQKITKIAHKTVKNLIQSGVEWGFQNAQRHKVALDSRDLNAMRKACSERMKEHNPSNLLGMGERISKRMKKYCKEYPEKHPNFIMAQKGHRTKIEKNVGEVLESLNLNAVFNYSVDGCFIDWAIPDLKIGIECDGAYWHQDKEKDLIRDRRIESFGWTLLHLKESEIENNIELCRRKISRLVKNHLGNYEFIPLQIKSVKTRLLGRGRMLYNFAVEEDESYIAMGLVSHNCRCMLSYITADERGVVQRIEKYKPVDPDLLAKWSSKIYTDAEIREMAKTFKEAKPLTYEGTVDSESERILRAGLRTKTEHGAAIDAKGKVIMKRAGKSPDVVTLTPDDLEKMRVGKAKGFIHNHPGGASFSADDIDFANKLNLDEMMAVGKEYKYTIKQGPRGWPTVDADELNKIWNSARDATQAKYSTIYKEARGRIEWEELHRRQSHEIMEGMSKKLGFVYKRSTW